MYTINKHSCMSLFQKLESAMEIRIEFDFLVNEYWNQGEGGVNDYLNSR